jgi:predicted dehydrogenase
MSRRGFLSGLAASAATVSVLPRSVFAGAGQIAPSDRIGIGFIGVGRIAQGHLNYFGSSPETRVVAVSDLDANRREAARKRFTECGAYKDFREMLARPDVDAVLIATPDHWHVPAALHAVRAGKDVYIEKPLSLTIEEGRVLSDAVRRYGRVLQVGSQQRSDGMFRHACELARNGKLGTIQTVEVGLPADGPGKPWKPEPVPAELDYEMWLGQAPSQPYTEERVHPQKGFGRPGWLCIRDYGSGMITGWGAHHLDITQWGLGTELSGPVSVEGRATFPATGLFDCPTWFHIEYTYASGVKAICDNKLTTGVRFVGTDGWVFVTRGSEKASADALLKWSAGANDVQLYKSRDHHANFIECIRSRRAPVAAVEIGHRSATVCHLGWLAMTLERKLQWDPAKECFVNDAEADRLRSRPMRPPWTL